MAKKRIHQIAKELDLASADILHQAKELGIEVKTASSGLTEAVSYTHLTLPTKA